MSSVNVNCIDNNDFVLYRQHNSPSYLYRVDISTVPQTYTVHCLADCRAIVNITSENTPNTLISSLYNTTTANQLCNYSVPVQWYPDVPYSGNPTWKCAAQREYLTETLQTYVRGKPAHMMHDHHYQHCVVPAAAPSSLTLNTNSTILSWTPLDGVCGYVIYAYTLLPPSNIEEPSSACDQHYY